MCVILVLEPGVMPDKSKLFNAVYNNWHGYGLVYKGKKAFDVIKKSAERDGEITPEEVWELLESKKQYLRYLHLRHNTAGATSLDNTHPFEVLRHGDDIILFMHNGTLYEYKSKISVPSKFTQGSFTMEDDPNGPSDTKNFVDQVLTPYLGSLLYNGRIGDLTNPNMRKLISKFWSTPQTNRGILLSKKQEHWMFGAWEKIKNSGGQEISVSNTDYFDSVKRGPEKERRDVQAAQAKAKVQAQTVQTNQAEQKVVQISDLSELDLTQGLALFEIKGRARQILDDYNIWDREVAAKGVGNLTKADLLDIANDTESCVALMDWIFCDYATLNDEYEELRSKCGRQEKRIMELNLAAKAEEKETA